MKELELELNRIGNGETQGFKEGNGIIRFVLSKSISHKDLIIHIKKKKL